ncbi:hypothetical protein MSG28_006652 [Choristoneura fumiferana]|uniref:Uncharacterized protein n=1 Tax=Choristoneura fumiferana TaxID=7141 RepID=A0ACC0JKS1_CHOFU|nr:hypothetical protein MSG28_006652 [Choristoneura fumiferana]
MSVDAFSVLAQFLGKTSRVKWGAGMEDEVTFLFQLGVLRDAVAAPAHALTLAHLKELAVKFVHEKIPDNGLNRLSERILLFRHDYCSPNVLQLINSASDVADETLVEIVLTANPLLCGSESEAAPLPRPHALAVHSYKAPPSVTSAGRCCSVSCDKGSSARGRNGDELTGVSWMRFGMDIFNFLYTIKITKYLETSRVVIKAIKLFGLWPELSQALRGEGAVQLPGGGAARRGSAAPRSPSRASTASHASHASHDDSLVRRIADLLTVKSGDNSS